MRQFINTMESKNQRERREILKAYSSVVLTSRLLDENFSPLLFPQLLNSLRSSSRFFNRFQRITFSFKDTVSTEIIPNTFPTPRTRSLLLLLSFSRDKSRSIGKTVGGMNGDVIARVVAESEERGGLRRKRRRGLRSLRKYADLRGDDEAEEAADGEAEGVGLGEKSQTSPAVR